MKLLSAKSKTILSVLFITAAVGLFSCQKESSNSNQQQVSDEESIAMTEESAEAESEMDDVVETGMSVSADVETAIDGRLASGETVTLENGRSTTGIRFDLSLFVDLSYKIGPCTKVTIEPLDSTFPKKIVVNYGDGCVCKDGKFRKGIVTFNYSAPLRKPGAVLTITFENYQQNRVKIGGTKIIKNLSEGSTHAYSVTIINGYASWASGRGFKIEGTKTVKQTAGADTRIIRDDVYSIEGRSKITYANGVVVTKNTETPLVKAVECHWISKGVLKITVNSHEVYIDYGTGTCDNKATVKWSGGTKEITLPW